MKPNCATCKKDIIKSQQVLCAICKAVHHPACVKLASTDLTRYLDWQCPTCRVMQPRENSLAGANAQSSTTSSSTASSTPRASKRPAIGSPVTDLSPTHNNNTECKSDGSLVVQIERMLDSKLNELKDSLTAEFRRELKTVSAKYDHLELSHAQLSDEHNLLRKEFDTLKKKSDADGDKISDLHSLINKQQQLARLSNIEIVGLPETTHESAVELAVKIASHAGVQLQCTQIESAHRVQPMRKIEGRPRPIVVKLQSRTLKDQIISGLRKTKGITTRDLGLGGVDRRFFVNEHLTPENKQLFNAIKSRAKDKSYKFVWVRNCNIFLRKNEESPVVAINSLKDLQKIT